MTTQALNIEVSASTSGLLTAMMEAGNMTERQAQRMLASVSYYTSYAAAELTRFTICRRRFY